MINRIIELSCDYAGAGISAPEKKAELHTYVLDNSLEVRPLRKRTAIVICPGGAYAWTSFRESEPIAIRFAALGFQTFVLKYSCAPAVFPAPQLELAAAIALIRDNASDWHVDPHRVVAAGFSAGGHLAASLGVFWDKELPTGPLAPGKKVTLAPKGKKPKDIRPDALLLAYPVITSGKYAHKDSFKAHLGNRYEELHALVSLENQVSCETPPAFIWHTNEDELVPAENSMLFATALRRSKVPFELHLYGKGRHGLAAADEETINALGWGVQKECQNWIDMAAAWMRNL